ncbi:MAG: calcium/sodium antiporter [Candidatus Lindowbacteria bacterium]|nr:calcium/sodium antiporter [Candidatus Lindowbacteria bacterium]
MFILIGFIGLTVGAECLVRGAKSLALRLGISSLVIGLTVVAFATSAPELAVCVQAALGGSSDIAMGNIVGSNIANILLILGITALVFPISIEKSIVSREIPVMLCVTALLLYMIQDLMITKIDGGILFSGIVIYTGFSYWSSKNGKPNGNGEPKDVMPAWKASLLVLIGIVSLVYGADWFVNGAVIVATFFGVSERVIGLTLVAFGTSLPEVATAISAALKKECDIITGNIIGSNIFNILMILGISSLVQPIEVSTATRLMDAPIMAGVAIMLWPLAARTRVLGRGVGVFFLVLYGAYISYLFTAI